MVQPSRRACCGWNIKSRAPKKAFVFGGFVYFSCLILFCLFSFMSVSLRSLPFLVVSVKCWSLLFFCAVLSLCTCVVLSAWTCAQAFFSASRCWLVRNLWLSIFQCISVHFVAKHFSVCFWCWLVWSCCFGPRSNSVRTPVEFRSFCSRTTSHPNSGRSVRSCNVRFV